MGDARYIPNRRFPQSVLKGAAAAGVCGGVAAETAARASAMDGNSYGSRTAGGRRRAHAFAFTASRAAMESNRSGNTLLKSLGG